jgi:hypothetical protein
MLSYRKTCCSAVKLYLASRSSVFPDGLQFRRLIAVLEADAAAPVCLNALLSPQKACLSWEKPCRQ